MKTRREEWQRSVHQSTLIERFDSVLYPVDLLLLFDRLPDLGWVVGEPILEVDTLKAQTPVKGNVRIVIDQGNKTLGVAGKELLATLSAYRDLRSLSRQFSDMSEMVRTDYVELRYIGTMQGRSVPTETFAQWWSGSESILRLGELLGGRLPSDVPIMSPYGLRFATKGKPGNRPNWAELTITPVTIAAESRYHFDLLFRNEQSDLTEQVAESANQVLELVLAELENA